MCRDFKHLIRKSLFYIEEHLGFFVGLCGRVIPRAGNAFFLITVSFVRQLPDWMYLSLFPFVNEMGKTLYDRRNPCWLDVRLVNGSYMRVDVSEKTQRQIYMHKIFETGLTRYLLMILKPGDVFVDAGANVGYFTILSAKIVGAEGRVISIEPELHNLESLKSNIELNGYRNVAVYECAVGQKESIQTLNVNPLNRGGNSLIPFAEYKSGDERYPTEKILEKFGKEKLFQSVQVRTLDDITKENNLSAIAFMKMDVEGFEYEALMGAKELIQKHKIKRIICEISNEETRGEILKIFRESGYTPYSLSFSGELIPLKKDRKNYPRDILFVV